MKPGAPWSVKGIEPEARETAKSAARRAGMTLGEWLNHVIRETGDAGPSADPLRDPESWMEETGTALPWIEPIEALSSSVAEKLQQQEARSSTRLKSIEAALGSIADRMLKDEGRDGVEATLPADVENRLTEVEGRLKGTLSRDHLKTLEQAVSQISVVLEGTTKAQTETFEEKLEDRFSESQAALADLDLKLSDTQERVNQALSSVEAAAELYEITDRQGRIIDSLVMDVAALHTHQKEEAGRQRDDLHALARDVTELRDSLEATDARLAEALTLPATKADEAVARIADQMAASEDRTATAMQQIEEQVGHLSSLLETSLLGEHASDQSAEAESAQVTALANAVAALAARLDALEAEPRQIEVQQAEAPAPETLNPETLNREEEPYEETTPAEEVRQALEPPKQAQERVQEQTVERPAPASVRPPVHRADRPLITFRSLKPENNENVQVNLAVRAVADLVKRGPVLAMPTPDETVPEADLDDTAGMAEDIASAAQEEEFADALEMAFEQALSERLDEALSEAFDEALSGGEDEELLAEDLAEDLPENLAESQELDAEVGPAEEIIVALEEETDLDAETRADTRADTQQVMSPAEHMPLEIISENDLTVAVHTEDLINISASDFEDIDEVIAQQPLGETEGEAHEADAYTEDTDALEEFSDGLVADDDLDDEALTIADIIGLSEAQRQQAEADLAATRRAGKSRRRGREEEEALRQAEAKVATMRASWAARSEATTNRNTGSIREVTGDYADPASQRGWALVAGASAIAIAAGVWSVFLSDDGSSLVNMGERPGVIAQLTGLFGGKDEAAGKTTPTIVKGDPFGGDTKPDLSLQVSFTPGLTEAAEAGDAKAQFALARAYANGDGRAVDRQAALKWYRTAADQGLAIAQYVMGSLYERGIDVAEDKREAINWYAAASRGGNRRAMHNLAVAYARGEDIPQDLEQAAYWFREAAQLGLPDAQYNLALLHERGLGVPKDPQAAYKWYAIAAEGGDASAEGKATALEDTLNQSIGTDDVARLNKEINAWQPMALDPIANGLFDISPAAYDNADQRASVAQVQVALTQLGFNLRAEDGIMDPSTQAAIRTFESQNDLAVSGKVTPQLLEALTSPGSPAR